MFSDDCTEISQKISYICHMICWYWTMDSWNCYTSFHFIASFKVTHFMVETFNCFLGTWHSIYDMFFILIDNVKNLQIFFICCYEMIDDTNIIGNKFAGLCLCILSWIRVIRSFYTFAITCQDSERLNIMFFFQIEFCMTIISITVWNDYHMKWSVFDQTFFPFDSEHFLFTLFDSINWIRQCIHVTIHLFKIEFPSQLQHFQNGKWK